jgi:hypothetical protein
MDLMVSIGRSVGKKTRFSSIDGAISAQTGGVLSEELAKQFLERQVVKATSSRNGGNSKNESSLYIYTSG